MTINKLQGCVIGLVLATTLGANLQSVNAMTNMPVDSSEDGAALVFMGQMISRATTLITTMAPLSMTSLPMIMASADKTLVKEKNQGNVLTKPASNQSFSTNNGTFVTTSYNTESMKRKMEDIRNLAYLGMMDVEPISESFNKELKKTNQIAFSRDYLCANQGNQESSLQCQNKNFNKAMAMFMTNSKVVND